MSSRALELCAVLADERAAMDARRDAAFSLLHFSPPMSGADWSAAVAPVLRQLLTQPLDFGLRDTCLRLLRPPAYHLPDWPRKRMARRGSDKEFLQRAIDLAVENVESGRGGPFGAVVVHKGRIIAEGTNLVTLSNDPSNHAEVLAIREAAFRLHRVHLDDCVIYSSCEPCPMCLGAIHWARISELYFAATREDAAAAGFDDSFIYDQVPLAPVDRSIPATQNLARAGAAPLHAWPSAPDRIEY